jgi:hypothetical protein
MFTYQVYTEEEAIEERFNLLKEGEYDAVIISSEDRVSSSGNPMMAIMLQVFDENGKARDVRDYLVFTKGMAWKVIDFANSAGVSKQYVEGKLCSEIVVGNCVRAKIKVQEGDEISQDKLKGKPDGSKYPSKNVVDYYIKRSIVIQKESKPVDQFKDDILPF